jgi:hypothetical protein
MTMSEHLNEQLSALADGELEGDALVAAESHILECDACRAALDGLRALKRRAAALDDRAPATDLWAGIHQRITGEHAVVPIAQAPSRRKRFAFSVPQLAAAAIAVMMISGGAVALLMKQAPAAGMAAEDAALEPGADALPVVETRLVKAAAAPGIATYDVAIRELELTLTLRRSRLDTATVRVLEQSMRLIDTAITQAREALARDPNNFYLNSHLQNALGRKLDLLRHVATLPTVS